MAHLQRFGAQLRGLAAGDEEIVQLLGRLADQALQDRRLHARHGKLEPIADPIPRSLGVLDGARFDRRFEPLRIAIRADRKRRAGELEKAGKAHLW